MISDLGHVSFTVSGFLAQESVLAGVGKLTRLTSNGASPTCPTFQIARPIRQP
jgi:hypothetical protein